MRILMAHKFYWPKAGAETYVFALTRLLEEAGHTVIPFAMQHPNNLPSPYAKHFVSQVEFRGRRDPLRDVGRAARVIWSHEARQKLEALLLTEAVDVAHLHNIAHQLSPSILGPLTRRGVPVVQTMHDYKLVCPVYTFRSHGEVCERCKGGNWWQVAARRCNGGSFALSATNAVESYLHAIRKTYRSVDVFHCPALFVMAKLVEHGIPREKLAFVPHFVEWERYAPASAPGRYAFFAGRLSEEKGLATLLEAHRRAEGVELVIAGDGPMRASLEARVTPEQRARLRFAGHLKDDAFEAAWRDAAFLVLPSEWYEVRPMVIHEAMARGKAVLSTSIGTIPEIVEDGVTGRLVPPADATALAAALVEMSNDPVRCHVLGGTGRARVETLYGPKAHLDAMLDVYRQAARKVGRTLPTATGAAA